MREREGSLVPRPGRGAANVDVGGRAEVGGVIEHPHGDAAQVRFTGDTVFLLRFPDGWRIGAAGCTSRGDAPYDCEVRG